MSFDILQAEKAKFIITDGKYKGEEVLLQFNPPTLSIEHINEFSEKKLMGLKGVVNQFTGSKKADLSLELIFDSTSLGTDVRDKLKDLNKIVQIDNELHAPPPCQFKWSKTTFDGIVTSFKKEFTYFFSDGTPARAKVSISLKPYTDVEKMAKSLDYQSSDISKKRVLNQGDTIFDMAYREYRNSAMWRLIAKANDIDDPLSIEYGTTLILPSKDKDE